MEEDDVIQPISVWITYDCRSKEGHLGVRFDSPAGKVDLAEILVDLSIPPPQLYQWHRRDTQVHHYYGLIQENKSYEPVFIEAMRKLFLTAY